MWHGWTAQRSKAEAQVLGILTRQYPWRQRCVSDEGYAEENLSRGNEEML